MPGQEVGLLSRQVVMVMHGEKCTAPITTAIAVVANFVLPAFGAHPEARVIMPNRSNALSITVQASPGLIQRRTDNGNI